LKVKFSNMTINVINIQLHLQNVITQNVLLILPTLPLRMNKILQHFEEYQQQTRLFSKQGDTVHCAITIQTIRSARQHQ